MNALQASANGCVTAHWSQRDSLISDTRMRAAEDDCACTFVLDDCNRLTATRHPRPVLFVTGRNSMRQGHVGTLQGEAGLAQCSCGHGWRGCRSQIHPSLHFPQVRVVFDMNSTNLLWRPPSRCFDQIAHDADHVVRSVVPISESGTFVFSSRRSS